MCFQYLREQFASLHCLLAINNQTVNIVLEHDAQVEHLLQALTLALLVRNQIIQTTTSSSSSSISTKTTIENHKLFVSSLLSNG